MLVSASFCFTNTIILKSIITILLTLFTYITVGNTVAEIRAKEKPDYTQLYQTVWCECRGESVKGIKLVIDVVKNRMSDPFFPDELDDVLLQPNQFCTFQSEPTEHFKALVDSLYNLPTQDSFLYFINPTRAKKAKWMKNKRWIKVGNHSFSK